MEKGKNYVFERKQSKTCTFNISCNAQKRNYKVKGIFYFLSSLFFNIQKKRHCFLLFPNENSNFVQFAISVAYMSSLKIDTTKPSSKILCRNVSCEPREAKTYARLVFLLLSSQEAPLRSHWKASREKCYNCFCGSAVAFSVLESFVLLISLQSASELPPPPKPSIYLFKLRLQVQMLLGFHHSFEL